MKIHFENIEIFIGALILFLIILKNICEAKRCINTKTVPVSVILSITMLIILMPILTALVCIFALYRQIINIILKIKYGPRFTGLLKGADAFHMVDIPSRSVIHGLMMIKCITKRSPEDFFDSIKQVLWKLHRHSKFKMIFLKTCGYSYMLKGELTVDDCVKKMKTINCKKTKIEKAELFTLLNDCCNAPLAKNGTLPWEVLVGTQAVNWKEDETKYYPLLFRINHAVADGVTLMKLMIGSLADEQDVKMGSVKSYKSSSKNSCSSSANNCHNHCKMGKETNNISIECFTNISISFYNRLQKILEFLMMSIYTLFLFPASLIVTFVVKAKDCNILHGPSLTGQKILALSIEQSQKYFLKTKRIKNKIPGTTFSDVLITAFSASLTDYFKKYSAYPPEYITTTIPMLPGSLDVQRVIPGQFDVNSLKLGNGYSCLLMNIPIANNNKNEDQFRKSRSLISKLELIKKERIILKNSIDYQVNYFMMSTVCSILPHSVVKFMLSGSHCSAVLSILPGPPKVTYGGGSMVVSDLVPWVPHLHNIGTTFSINTYDGRLHIGLSVDKAFIADQNDAQSIVDGIYKYLDLLEIEVNSVY